LPKIIITVKNNNKKIKPLHNEHAASMRGLSVRKVVVAAKMETKSKDKIC
jgi:hypothetical protein